jgi:uncharacterized protein
MFDTALGAWVGREPDLCVFAETCGHALVLEHNGDLYACDHFVYPEYHLGNLKNKTVRQMVESPEQTKFGQDKRDALPAYCVGCDFRFACNGGCPKHRFVQTPEGEDGLNYLCRGYKRFFGHVDEAMRFMADELKAGRPAANVVPWMRQKDAALAAIRARAPGRNAPCPCGSGRKYKHCCGRAA